MGKFKIKLNHLLTLVVLFAGVGCDTTDPPDNKSLTLKLEDVSCTEAWIEITTTNLTLPTTVTLNRPTQLAIQNLKS